MTEPRDPRKDLRRLIDSVEPVTDAEARAVADAEPGLGAVEPSGDTSHRGALLAAVAAVVVLLVGGGVLVWRQSDDDTVTTGPATTDVPTTLGPATTVLAPAGDDPIVSCDPWSNEWYPLSAWSQPTGAENAGDPAATAFRNYLALTSALETANSVVPLVSGLPTNDWRRLAETDTEVLFGAGELDLDGVAGDELGPLISVHHIVLVDGHWQWDHGGGGSCNELYVYPGDGDSVAYWGVTDDRPLSPDTTELHLAVEQRGVCPQPVTEEDLVGPDVVETDESITIRVAFAVLVRDEEDCGPDLNSSGEPEPVRVTVHLRQPLGDRVVIDANQYPPVTDDLEPEFERVPPSSEP